MKKVTIKEYAIKHKLSIFNVVKMVKSGELKSQTIIKNKKEHIYIILDNNIEEEIEEGIIKSNHNKNVDDCLSLEEIVQNLQEEVKLLREDISKLMKKLH